MSMETCGDDRFELIEEAKRRLLEATNIEDRPEELAVLDSILFRFWQMGWLDQLREDGSAGTCHNVGDERDFCCSECGVRMFIESDDTYTMIASDERTIIVHPNFCPNCGRRVG